MTASAWNTLAVEALSLKEIRESKAFQCVYGKCRCNVLGWVKRMSDKDPIKDASRRLYRCSTYAEIGP